MNFEEEFPSFLKEAIRLSNKAEKKNDFLGCIIADRQAMQKCCLDKQRIKELIEKLDSDDSLIDIADFINAFEEELELEWKKRLKKQR